MPNHKICKRQNQDLNTAFPGGSAVKNLPSNAGDTGLIPERAQGFPSDSEVKASVCNAGDPGLIPESRRSPGGVNGSPLKYSCLENPIEGRAW